MHLTGLARVARNAGITVREVPGWQTRTAHKGGMTRVVGVIWHHTATPAASVVGRNNPTTQYMTNGLGYPLANYGLAWDGSLDVIAAGTGAHAGKGSYKGVPNNDGNRHMIGIEVEGTIGLTWSPAQLETAARLGAALNREFGTSLLHIGHYEWAPGRKTDPTGIPGMMPALRTAIQRGTWGTVIATASNKTPTTVTTSTPTKGQPKPTTSTGGLTVSDVNKIIDEVKGAQRQVSAVFTRQREYQDATNTTLGALGARVQAVEDRVKAQATANQVNAVYVRQREYQAALEETIKQLSTGTGVAIDYDKVKEAARAGAEAALSEGVAVEGTATVTLAAKGN